MSKYRNLDKYLVLFNDCLAVKGIINATICDFSRNKIEIIPADYHNLIKNFKKNKICNIYLEYEVAEHSKIDMFIDFLLENEYIFFADEISLFPKIEKKWESPEHINNAIIDVKNFKFNFTTILKQLDELNCQFLQLRFFSNLYSLSEISSILNEAIKISSSLKGVEILIKYHTDYNDKDYISFYENNLLLSSLYIHSSPFDKTIDINFGYTGKSKKVLKSIQKNFFYVSETIEDSNRCGKIDKSYFCVNNIKDALHNSCYNSCLNKKIGIDIDGNIKNCPSIKASYGNILNTKLKEAYSKKGFKKLWNKNKNFIDVCKVCEFRLVCTDCRAFIVEPENINSKPLKCGYDPYSGKWEDWRFKNQNKKAIKHYKI